MKDRPILFSGPMVRAVLDGTKTQTRRVVKPQPPAGADSVIRPFSDERRHWAADDPHDIEQGRLLLGPVPACPYGTPGDRLWVREAWSTHISEDHLPPRECSRTIRFYEVEHGAQRGMNPRIGKLRPSMFMPRWHSRIALGVTGVRVERLQDISEADAIAEGVCPDPFCRKDDDAAGFHRIGKVRGDSFPIARYALLWEFLNGFGSWAANPWVVVIEFRRTET